MKLTHHWVADIFPLNESDVERLADDIKANGQRQPIITWQGQILDGRTRYAACKRAGVDPLTEEYRPQNGEVTDDELLALSWSLNETRRHLTTSQRACAAAEVHNRLPDGRGKKSKNRLLTLGEQFTVAKATVAQALALLRESPELFKQVKAGELTVGAAHDAYRKTKDLERVEIERNSLAELRQKHPDLAEQVENGQITVDEAEKQLDAEATAKRQRTEAVGKIATGVFVAVSGLQLASESMAEIKTTISEVVGTRQYYQLKDDRKRLEVALAILEEFLKQTKKKE